VEAKERAHVALGGIHRGRQSVRHENDGVNIYQGDVGFRIGIISHSQLHGNDRSS
jgi:hypothetical protein